jgi:hypothetical protein
MEDPAPPDYERVEPEWRDHHIFDEGELAHFNLPGARDRTDPVYKILLASS